MKPISILLALTSLSPASAFAAHPYEACIQKVVQSISEQTHLTIQETSISDYGYSTYTAAILSRLSNGTWEKSSPPSSRGVSFHAFRIQAKTDQTNLTFGFQLKLFEVKTSVFGSGQSTTSYECCVLGSDVSVKDNGSGLSKDFPHNQRECGEYKNGRATEESVVSVKQFNTNLCAAYGKKLTSWKTEKEWEYENPGQTVPCSNNPHRDCIQNGDTDYYKTVQSHSGCQLKGGNPELDSSDEEEEPLS